MHPVFVIHPHALASDPVESHTLCSHSSDHAGVLHMIRYLPCEELALHPDYLDGTHLESYAPHLQEFDKRLHETVRLHARNRVESDCLTCNEEIVCARRDRVK